MIRSFLSSLPTLPTWVYRKGPLLLLTWLIMSWKERRLQRIHVIQRVGVGRGGNEIRLMPNHCDIAKTGFKINSLHIRRNVLQFCVLYFWSTNHAAIYSNSNKAKHKQWLMLTRVISSVKRVSQCSAMTAATYNHIKKTKHEEYTFKYITSESLK